MKIRTGNTHHVLFCVLVIMMALAPCTRGQSGVTAQLEPEDLGNLPGFNSSSVLAVSPDGTAVLGFAFNMGPPSYNASGTPGQFFRWTAATGPVAISPVFPEGLPVTASYHLSDDGRVIVGYFWFVDTPDHLFYWSAATGWTTLPALPGYDRLWPYAISADGSAVVGVTTDTVHNRPFLWTAAAGTVELASPAGDNNAEPHWVSNGGSNILGYSYARLGGTPNAQGRRI